MLRVGLMVVRTLVLGRMCEGLLRGLRVEMARVRVSKLCSRA